MTASLTKADNALLMESIKGVSRNKPPSKQLMGVIDEIALRNNAAPRTIATRYSSMKKILTGEGFKRDKLVKVRPKPEVTESILQKNQELLENRKITKVSMEIVDSIKALKESDDMFALATYLLFISGRRVSELLEAEYSPVRGNGKKYVWVTGIKKRTDDVKIKIKVVTTAADFIQNYRKFRSMYNKYGKSVNSFNRSLNRWIKKNVSPTLKPHSLRGIYAKYMYKYENPNGLVINAFIKEALGQQSLNSSLSYTQFQLTT